MSNETVKILTYLFWFIFIIASYLAYRYKKSRNKHLFFKTGLSRSLITIFFLLLIAPVLVNILIPDNFLIEKMELMKLDKGMVLSNLKDGNLWLYFSQITGTILHNINLIGFISACLILFTWFVYICRVDLFDKEHIKYPIVTLLLGMCFSLLALLLSDLLALYYPINFTGNFFNDLFIFCFLKIGVIEEFVKLLPFFIILKLTRQVNEPYDYILYASVSALGFAFIENLIYFQDLEGQVIQGRAFLSVIAHILFSSYCVYGLVLAKYRFTTSPVGLFLIYFFIGAFIHGLYDYLLFNSMGFMAIAIFIFAVQVWTVMVNNTINNSNFFNFNISFREEKLRFFLAIMLTSVVILNYVSNTLHLGKEAANHNFFITCLFAGFFLLFYVASLSNYDLIKGYWRPIYIRTSPVNINQVPGNRGMGKILSVFKYNFITPLNFINYKITLHPPHYNHELYETMDLTHGKIIDRVCIERVSETKRYIDTDWFLVELENDLRLEGCVGTQVLIKLEDNTSSLIHDEDVRAYIRIIPDLELLKKETPFVDDFPFVGYIFINAVEVPGLLESRQ